MNRSGLQNVDVFAYLVSLPKELLDSLFQDPWTCQAIFRALPALAKQFVSRMLYIEAPLSEAIISSWVKPEHSSKLKAALDRLRSLHIIQETTPTVPSYSSLSSRQSSASSYSSRHTSAAAREPVQYVMHRSFQKQLKQSLQTSGLPAWATTPPNFALESGPSAASLSIYASHCWEVISHFMIGTSDPSERPPSDRIIDLLASTHLMISESDDSLRISNAGFQFLLKDTHSQLWMLLLTYVDTAETRGVSKSELLSFLFQLSFLTVAHPYSLSSVSPAKAAILGDLREFGLVYLEEKPKSQASAVFYVTPLVSSLSSVHSVRSNAVQPSETEGFIVLENNYRLYAYTQSDLQICILSLFTKLQYRLPNLIVGVITRESIRQALINGITADQVVNYLRHNAHPEMRKKFPVLPETVADQIRLWEAERNRIKYNKGILMDHFPSMDTFKSVRQHAEKLGVLLWSHASKDQMMITEEGNDAVKEFLKSISS